MKAIDLCMALAMVGRGGPIVGQLPHVLVQPHPCPKATPALSRLAVGRLPLGFGWVGLRRGGQRLGPKCGTNAGTSTRCSHARAL